MYRNGNIIFKYPYSGGGGFKLYILVIELLCNIWAFVKITSETNTSLEKDALKLCKYVSSKIFLHKFYHSSLVFPIATTIVLF